MMEKERSRRQRSRREALIAPTLVLCIHAGVKLLGWGSQDLSWRQVVLVARAAAAIYWTLASEFRQFAEEDVVPPSPREP